MPTKNAFLKCFKNATSNNEFFKFDVAFIPPKGRGWALVGLTCRVGKSKCRKGCELNQIRAIAAITYLPTYLLPATFKNVEKTCKDIYLIRLRLIDVVVKIRDL